jgi:hypothetical protein
VDSRGVDLMGGDEDEVGATSSFVAGALSGGQSCSVTSSLKSTIILTLTLTSTCNAISRTDVQYKLLESEWAKGSS